MMGKLTIVATTLAKPDQREFVKSELLKLIEPTRKEDGCISYELYNDNDDNNLFIFQEVWESLELLEKHLDSDHIKVYLDATDGKVLEFVVHKLSPVL